MIFRSGWSSRRPKCLIYLTLDTAAGLLCASQLSNSGLTVLSLLLERVAEQACDDTWRNIKDDLRRIKLAQLLSPNGTVWQVTEPAPDALKRLKSLQIPKPQPILHLA